ncbi:hypothetical protein AYO38_08940 [bacterium SCGC AG-212-C10]|nr:hypothetical protein AYO38_08940 [bacterium SCGC AG-212-C10]
MAAPVSRKASSEGIIRRTPGVVGGSARIRNTRIPVWLLVEIRQAGQPDSEFFLDYPDLTPEDLQAAWSYYEGHKDEIDNDIAENDA